MTATDPWSQPQAADHRPPNRVLVTLAQNGRNLFTAIGVLIGLVVAFLWGLFPDPASVDDGFAGRLLGGTIVFTPITTIIGVIIGFGVQRAARSWLRNSGAPIAPAPPPDLVTGPALTPGSRWARSFDRCRQSVDAFHRVAGTVESPAARKWLEDLGHDLDAELAEAHHFAVIGQSLDADGDSARRAAQALDEAELSFAQTAERAGAVALDVESGLDFTSIKAQLDVLSEQAPQLRAQRGL